MTAAVEQCQTLADRLSAAEIERDALRVDVEALGADKAALIADKEALLTLGANAVAALEERRREADLIDVMRRAEHVRNSGMYAGCCRRISHSIVYSATFSCRKSPAVLVFVGACLLSQCWRLRTGQRVGFRLSRACAVS